MENAATANNAAPLELGMQELEELDAPGFWTGFFYGGSLVTLVTTVGFAAT